MIILAPPPPCCNRPTAPLVEFSFPPLTPSVDGFAVLDRDLASSLMPENA